MPSPWAIYTRLSHDRTGEQTATARQEHGCRRFAGLRGWTIGTVYEDVDFSAYQPQVARPALLRLLADIETGAVGGVLVWKLDRLMRRPADFEDFWKICQSAGIPIASATEPLDTSTEIGLAVVRILVTFAHLESATRGQRLSAKNEEKARAGLPPSNPGYGYHRDMRINRSQAAHIREAAARLIAGDSPQVIAADWTRRHVPTARGGRWRGNMILKMVSSPRVVGDRAYQGQVLVRDAWRPILDRTTAARAAAAGKAWSFRRPSPGSRHLLAGLVFCHCGEQFRFGAAVREQVNPDCGHCGTTPRAITESVVELLFEREPGSVAWESPRTGQEDAERFLGHRERMVQLWDDYYETRMIGRTEFIRRRNDLILALDADERRYSGLSLAEVVGDEGIPLRVRWLGMNHHQRRSLVRHHVARIVVHPNPGTNRFDRSRLEIHWWADGPPGSVVHPERLCSEDFAATGWLDTEEARAIAGGITQANFLRHVAPRLASRRNGPSQYFRREAVEAERDAHRVQPGELRERARTVYGGRQELARRDPRTGRWVGYDSDPLIPADADSEDDPTAG